LNCKETQNLLHGYVDGELDLVHNLEIERHLEDCASCLQTVKGLQALRAGLREAPLSYKAPAHLQKRIQAAVRKADRAESASPVFSWRWLPAAAAFAVVVLAAWGLWRVRALPSSEDLLAQEVIAGHVRSLMASHLADVPSSDQHTVKPWFHGKLDFAPWVEDLAAEGFPLVGGRLDYLDNRPVAALVYRRNQHPINLFLWPSAQEAESGTRALTRRGYHLFAWTHSGMNYWAVSDLNTRELQEFVRLVQERTASGTGANSLPNAP
jgi:anti-sigma factor RsiW